MKRHVLQNSKRLLLSILLVAAQVVAIPIQNAVATNDMSAACVIGTDSACPAQSPQEIYNLYGTTANGVYWLNVNGTATQTYVVLDTSYPEGGMWFLGMKAPRDSTTFKYDSTYWTDINTSLVPDNSNDVATNAKYNAFNYLPVVRVVAVFKDRASYNFNTNGSGDLGTNSFGGHTWAETITSQSMLTRFSTTSALVDSAGNGGIRNTLVRETNSGTGKLVFPFQTGWSRYGFNNTVSYTYRWGLTFNNESNYGSNDSGSGIGMGDYSSKAQVSYSDNLTVGLDGSSGTSSPGTSNLSSGFQIWGKMAAPSLATPGAITLSNQGGGNVQLTFAASAGATEYAIQYKTAGSNWNTSTTYRLTNPGATPTAVIPGVTQGSYDFRVFARGTNDSSAGNSYLLAQTIDATQPTISSIAISSNPGADSIYGLGESLTVSVTFSETVTVTGSPRIQLEGLSFKYATYLSGSNTKTILLNYVVASGDLDRDGIYLGANSLILNSGTIKDLSNNTAILSHAALTASLSYQVDGTLPTLSAITVAGDGSSITLLMNETLSATAPSNSSFAVLANSVSNPVTATSISGKSVTLTMTFAILSGATVTVAYTDPTAGNDANAIQDEAGNDAASISATSATNNSTLTSNTSASIALNPVSETAVYRAVNTIRVSTNTAGKVDFYQGGKIISGCRAKSTTANVANCSWMPTVHAYVFLTARFVPSGSGFTTTNSSPLRIFVTGRSGNR